MSFKCTRRSIDNRVLLSFSAPPSPRPSHRIDGARARALAFTLESVAQDALLLD
jgi:hypothetical protein